MRMLSFAPIAAALSLLIGGAYASPALAQSDSPAPAAAPAAGSDAPAPAKKKRRAKKESADAGAPSDAAAAMEPPKGPAATPAADAKPEAKSDAKDDSKPKSKSKRKKKGQVDTAPAAEAAPANGQIDLLAPPPATVAAQPAPAPAPVPQTTTVTIRTPAPAAAPVSTDYNGPVGPYDDDAPTIAHTAIVKAMKNKPLVFSAHITDPSGVFQPVLYLRKRGSGDYLPIKMIGSKVSQGEYAVEVDAKLISVDLEYYIECYDNAGNGPARVGTPETPLAIKLEEEKKIVVENGKPPPEKHVGAPPAIMHQTIAKAWRGLPVEINAKLVGDTGVSQAKVFFRHVGEHDFRTLPMGNIGGDDYTATMPASVVTNDLEYYLEAYDQYGNGPGRSGGPNVPYQITVTEKPKEVAPIPGGAIVEKPQPHLVKIPFSPNPGRWAGWIFMGSFVASTLIVGGELYGAYSADQVYQQTYNYSGQLDPALHQRTLAYDNRAKYFGIAAGASLAVSITLLVLFPEHPTSQLVTGSGGDVVLAHF